MVKHYGKIEICRMQFLYRVFFIGTHGKDYFTVCCAKKTHGKEPKKHTAKKSTRQRTKKNTRQNRGHVASNGEQTAEKKKKTKNILCRVFFFRCIICDKVSIFDIYVGIFMSNNIDKRSFSYFLYKK